jgi:hypothetical protein
MVLVSDPNFHNYLGAILSVWGPQSNVEGPKEKISSPNMSKSYINKTINTLSKKKKTINTSLILSTKLGT